MRRPSRVAALALLPLASLATTACGTTSRTLPRSALVDRARDGRDPPPSPRGRQALSFAAAQVGRRYCWGGIGPSCFDCSGLVQTAWRTAGISLPRTSTAMGSALSDVPLDEVRPGDVLWWPGHVAIYAGNGLEIEALDSRHGVVERPAATPYRALRPE
jgi:cell wall-associated NlpC family hydrolase